MLTFTVTLQAQGLLRHKMTVPAVERGLVGCWHAGKPYGPDAAAVRRRLPYRFRWAFDRANNAFWADAHGGPLTPMTCDLVRSDGAPMGTLVAVPDWHSSDAAA